MTSRNIMAGLVADACVVARGHILETYEIELDPTDGDDEMLDKALAVARRTPRGEGECDHDPYLDAAAVETCRRGYGTPLGGEVRRPTVSARICLACPRRKN
ncbi:hypothetical protein [Streptomyces aidingensis]|uniref:Uncharacterized protein n=1 Tax=Streptomyces aidingensis TaxID=910347 RepID=A0A1I1PXV0_9ACTN|nr:hypothetical protein [Streptomyces aidingensis]SFD14595.1 hypothetical protein SAMN05421773_110128 [Streptomyces aidingensis]